MALYYKGDMATFYFIIKEVPGEESYIKAWTDSKELARFYLKFHKCPYFRIKKITNTIEEIRKITGENHTDRISIGRLVTRDRERDDGSVTYISVPITDTEMDIVNHESMSFFSGRIKYNLMDKVIPSLKPKYRELMKEIFLPSVIKRTIHNQPNGCAEAIIMDQLMVLFQSFPDEFG